MSLIKVINPNSNEFKKSWEIYEYSFPNDERRNLKQQKNLFVNEDYNFFVKTNNNIVESFVCA
jgi:hypothetical protein